MRSAAPTLALLLMLGACAGKTPPPGEAGSAPPPATGTSSEAPKNTLKWSTASEVDNFGYDVYRGDGPDGPFTRITKQPLPGAGTTDMPSKYSFVDTEIEAGKTYYYYVESISMGGVRERFTPVIKKEPKVAGKLVDPQASGDAGAAETQPKP